MLVESLVLGGEDRIAHRFRHGIDLDHRAPFLAEFADQQALAAVDAQRHLGLVIGENLERRQRRVDDYCCKNKD